MAVNPQQAVEMIAHYYVNDHPNRPFPAHEIPVVPTLTRHTPLMAVVWNQVDANIMDASLNMPGDLMRVVYTLTVISQQRPLTARFTAWLATVVPYAPDHTFLTGYETPFGEASELSGVLSGYTLAPITPSAPQYPTLPERQQQELIITHPPVWETEMQRVEVYNTIVEGTQLDYNQGLDAWNGEVLCISHIGTRPADQEE